MHWICFGFGWDCLGVSSKSEFCEGCAKARVYMGKTNVMNTVSESILICLMERNILVLVYFGVPFHGVSRFLRKVYIFLYNIKLSIQKSVTKYQILQII